MMSNGPPPARPDGTVDDARWLFPQERAPPPRDEGCKQNGFGDPAPHMSNGSPPTPSPPSKSLPPSSASTSFPTLVTMGGIVPADACPPPAIVTEWRLYTSPEGLDGSFMVNLHSGERLWQPPALDWDYEWDIEPIPNPEGTWYRVPGSCLWVQFDVITSWIHRPTGYHCYLIEDTTRPISAHPSLPHQIELILAKLTQRGGVATPVESGRSLSPTLRHPMSYEGAILSTIGGDCQPSSQVLQSTTANESAAIAIHQMARRRKRPRRHPGRRNVPRAPNPADETIPPHPLPTMGGTSTPTSTHTKLACANDRDPRLPMSSASPPPMTLPSPTLQPFTLEGGTSTFLGGDSIIPSATMASFFHHGSIHDKSTALVMFVGATALEPPIHRSLVADADIGLGSPTYHPRPLKVS
jgi:hypothetical protein